MSKLRELLETELKDTDYVNLGVKKIADALPEDAKYINLIGGIGLPGIGVFGGEWSVREKEEIKNMADARNESDTEGHIVGTSLS